MTNQELIKAYRECKDHTGCVGCPVEHEGVAGCNTVEEFSPDRMIARLEALLAENEALNERDKARKELKQALERKCTALTVQNELLRGLKAGKDTNVPTLAQHIRAMSDFELMEFLYRINMTDVEAVIPYCGSNPECDELLDSGKITTEMCKQCLLQNSCSPMTARYDSANH